MSELDVDTRLQSLASSRDRFSAVVLVHDLIFALRCTPLAGRPPRIDGRAPRLCSLLPSFSLLPVSVVCSSLGSDWGFGRGCFEGRACSSSSSSSSPSAPLVSSGRIAPAEDDEGWVEVL